MHKNSTIRSTESLRFIVATTSLIKSHVIIYQPLFFAFKPSNTSFILFISLNCFPLSFGDATASFASWRFRCGEMHHQIIFCISSRTTRHSTMLHSDKLYHKNKPCTKVPTTPLRIFSFHSDIFYGTHLALWTPPDKQMIYNQLFLQRKQIFRKLLPGNPPEADFLNYQPTSWPILLKKQPMWLCVTSAKLIWERVIIAVGYIFCTGVSFIGRFFSTVGVIGRRIKVQVLIRW